MRSLLLGAALLLILAVTPNHVATDDNFGLEPSRGLMRAMRLAATACYECGEKARELKLHSWARSFYDHALRYNADHRPTRQVLGFRKIRGDWVLEEDLIPRNDDVNAADRQRTEVKLISDTLPIRREAADGIWPFVESTRLPVEQRLLALFHTLRICPEHRDAQRAARAIPGQQFFQHWLDDESTTFRHRWIEAAPEGKAIEELTPYMEASLLKMEARRSEWIVMHVFASTTEDWTPTLARFANSAHKRSHDVLGLPPGEPPTQDEHRLHYTVFTQRDHFAKFVDTCSNIADASKRSEITKVGYGTEVYRPYGAAYLSPGIHDQGPVRDGIAHDLGSKVITRHTAWNFYWLARGYGYLLSTQMNGSVAQQFYGLQTSAVIETGGRDALPGLGRSAAAWRLHAATDCAAGGGMTLSELVAARPADYKLREMAHAFSITEFLVAEHKTALVKFLKEAQAEMVARTRETKDHETGPELAQRLLKCLEMTEEEFNQARTAWVLENYVRLPGAE